MTPTIQTTKAPNNLTLNLHLWTKAKIKTLRIDKNESIYLNYYNDNAYDMWEIKLKNIKCLGNIYLSSDGSF